MRQQGQLSKLKTRGADGLALWAYRYRVGGRDSKRVQRALQRRDQVDPEAQVVYVRRALPTAG